MIVYKGFDRNMCCTQGKGIYQYEIGRTEIAEKSKTRSTGFHVSENPVECLSWYPWDGKNIICRCEAGGSIDEENSDVVCCTELTPVQMLTDVGLAVAILTYIYDHPKRECRINSRRVSVGGEKAAAGPDGIAIARGSHPRAKAGKNGIIGFILEKNGAIERVRMFRVGREIKENRWHQLNEEGDLV